MSAPGKLFVFLDHSGRRWPRLRFLGIVLGMAIGLGTFLFLGSLFIAPPLPSPLNVMKGKIQSLQKQYPNGQSPTPPSWIQYSKGREMRTPKKSRPKTMLSSVKSISPPQEIRLAYYLSNDAQNEASLRRHTAQLTHVATESLTLKNVDGDLEVRPDGSIASFLKKNHLQQLAQLSNFDGEDWQPEAVEYLAFGPQSHRDSFFSKLTTALSNMEVKGVLLDWEQLDPTYEDDMTNLLYQLASVLHDGGWELWLTVPMGNDLNAFDLPSISGAIDHFVAVMHDENGEEDSAGPIASSDWFRGWLQAILTDTDPSQWVVELGSYGYDWGRSQSKAKEISFADVMTRAHYSEADHVHVDAPIYNPTFSYSANGSDHTVWFLDAVTFYNQLRIANKFGIQDVAINSLGQEDPGIWQTFDLPRQGSITKDGLSRLEKIASEPRITHIGTGEIVTVENMNQTEGFRQVSQARDGSGELIALYKKFPQFPTLRHDGDGKSQRMALTFDDGPDPYWTPRILDILHHYHVTATFFVVGSNAEKYPNLLRRIVNEGHEIGSHTFTHSHLAVVPKQQVALELNATLRIIQGATGYSTQLFRPPYNADSEIEDIEELYPLQIAQDLGYLTVLEQIDPQDWSQPGTDQIVQRVKEQMQNGSIILLHDAGGNREQTLEALPQILDHLKEENIAVVSLAHLLETSNAQLMPPVVTPKNQMMTFAVSELGFYIIRILQNTVGFLLISATLLVVLRTLIIGFLAYRHWNKKHPWKNFTPPLSIIIPAFNEEKVIAATLQSLLASSYPAPFEILVVDDGSLDQTAAMVLQIAKNDRRVRLLQQTNAGKASALENGVANALYEILVFLDGDTHFDPTTLQYLVEPLANSKVGAVAGNPRVGNAHTLISHCQDIEYLMAFNLERRALSHWNAVTVVPGAVSAFRRQAIVESGGFHRDTLAEDTDLTLAMHEIGWRVDCVPEAIARTEAPESIPSLIKQRFRWALGTMQCVWKHRRQTFSRNNIALGWFSLPGIWLFQVGLVAVAPLIDLLFLQAALMGHWAVVLPYFLAFLLSDLVLAFMACAMESIPLRKALWVLPMRFIYRPILSYVIWKAIFAALRGVWVGWGKLDRTGSVTSPLPTPTIVAD